MNVVDPQRVVSVSSVRAGGKAPLVLSVLESPVKAAYSEIPSGLEYNATSHQEVMQQFI